VTGTVTGKGRPPGGNVLAGRRFLRRGDLVVASFAYQDNTCEFCREGLQTSCIHDGFLSEAQPEAKSRNVTKATSKLCRSEIGFGR
jgi:threonine dehydrogenase-like Zn-dependent dehydrogenase